MCEHILHHSTFAAVMPDGGRISSGVTWFAAPGDVYSMTKGALNVLGRSLANSLGNRNITINTISPDITDTDMNPSILDKGAEAIERVAAVTALGRPGRPADIADVIAFISSEDARWITGQTSDVTARQSPRHRAWRKAGQSSSLLFPAAFDSNRHTMYRTQMHLVLPVSPPCQ
jgi:hypothetical protein